MTQEQRNYLDKVQIEMAYLTPKFSNPPPIIDAALFLTLGYTPDEAAKALMGHDVKTLTKIIDHMRNDGTIERREVEI